MFAVLSEVTAPSLSTISGEVHGRKRAVAEDFLHLTFYVRGPLAKEDRMTVLAWSPLKGGLLTGKYLPEKKGEKDARLSTEMMKKFGQIEDAGLATVREVVAVAKEIGASPAQVSLAWLRYRPVPVIPIIGARKLPQLEDNLKSIELTLDETQLRRLNEKSAIPLGFPHDFFEMDMVRTFSFGGMRDRIKS